MYWTEQDDESVAVKIGDMGGDGKVTSLKHKEVKSPTNIALSKFQVYWVDSCGQRIEYKGLGGNRRHRFFESSKYPAFLPERIAILGERLYWLGVTTDRASEAILSTALGANGPLRELGLENVENDSISPNVTRVTGLAVYDATAMVLVRNNACAEGNSCSGICLLSGEGSCRCMCPIGLERSSSNGTYCRGKLHMFRATHYARSICLNSLLFQNLKSQLYFTIRQRM